MVLWKVWKRMEITKYGEEEVVIPDWRWNKKQEGKSRNAAGE